MPFDFVKEWILLPVWSYLVTIALAGIQASLFMRRDELSFVEPRRASRFSADRPIHYRTDWADVSIHQKNTSQAGDMTIVLAILMTIFYFSLRYWLLLVFSVVTGLSLGYSLTVSFILLRRSDWSSQYGFVVSCLVSGFFILLLGLWFACSPPQLHSLTLQAALTSDSFFGQRVLFRLSLPDWGWIALHVFGFFFLVFPARAMVFLGLGTMALSLDWDNSFWRWVIRRSSHYTGHPLWTSIGYIGIAGFLGLALLGGWGYDFLYPLITGSSN